MVYLAVGFAAGYLTHRYQAPVIARIRALLGV